VSVGTISQILAPGRNKPESAALGVLLVTLKFIVDKRDLSELI
jgi:hypothetical protein